MLIETPSNASAQDEKQQEAPVIEAVNEEEAKMSVNYSEPYKSEAPPIPTIPVEADKGEDLIEEGDRHPGEAPITDEESGGVLGSGPGGSSTNLDVNIDGKDFEIIIFFCEE